MKQENAYERIKAINELGQDGAEEIITLIKAEHGRDGSGAYEAKNGIDAIMDMNSSAGMHQINN